jgi:hypothetical protein
MVFDGYSASAVAAKAAKVSKAAVAYQDSQPLQLSVGEIRKSSNPCHPAASVRGIGGNVMAGGAS